MEPNTPKIAEKETDAPLIEVTSEMIEAAYCVWQEAGASDYVSPSDKVMLHEIIVAALATRGPVRDIPELRSLDRERTERTR